MMGLGTTEILIIAGILILLFGAKKLPDLARGSGRALRIFKSETKGLMKDEDESDPHGRPLPPGSSAHHEPGQQSTQQPVQQPVEQPTTQDSGPRDSQR